MRSVAAVLVLAAVASCSRQAPPSSGVPATTAQGRSEIVMSEGSQREAAIETRGVTTTDEPERLRVPGQIAIADDRSWRVGIRTDGLVVSVLAAPGDYVRKGQVLARYHADEVRDSRARYHAAQSELARAQSAAEQARRGSDRADLLLSLRAGSQQQAEQARQDVVAAQAAVRVSAIEVDRLKDLLEDDLRVPADPAPGDETADQVPILAPADGYVLERNLTLGKAVDTMDDTFVLGDLSQVWMLASVRQDQLGLLRVGEAVTVTVRGVGPAPFEGTVANLGQQLDPSTRTMPVRVVLANRGNVLRPGMLATADIAAGTRRAAMLVPSEAVQQVDGQDVVFVRTGPDRFAVRPVATSETVNGETPIREGLTGDEQVVVHGSFVLKSQLLRASLGEGE